MSENATRMRLRRYLTPDGSDIRFVEIGAWEKAVREDSEMPPWGSNMTAEDMMEHMSELAREQFLAMSPMREGG